MSLPEDTWTTTEAGTAAYERLRGRDEWIDNRPTEAELEADDRPPAPIVPGWRCPSCDTRHRDGSDPLVSGCPDCGWAA